MEEQRRGRPASTTVLEGLGRSKGQVQTFEHLVGLFRFHDQGRQKLADRFVVIGVNQQQTVPIPGQSQQGTAFLVFHLQTSLGHNVVQEFLLPHEFWIPAQCDERHGGAQWIKQILTR